MWKQIQVHIMIKSVILPLTFQENRRQISSSLKMDNSSKPSQVSPLQRFPQFQDCAGDIPQGLVRVGCQDPRVDLQGGEREGPQEALHPTRKNLQGPQQDSRRFLDDSCTLGCDIDSQLEFHKRVSIQDQELE